MRSQIPTACIASLIVCGSGLLPGQQIRPGHAVPTLTFPQIQSADLNGDRVTLPDDLNGQYRLVIIAYQRQDQQVVDPWLTLAKSWHLPESRLGIYEVPIIKDPGRVMREFIDAGMRSGIRDRDIRRRVITLYTDKAAMLRRLAIQDDSTIDVLLLDRAGSVVWRTEGELTATKRGNLERQLRSFGMF